MIDIKVGIIFGGKSNEHEVSIVSATSVLKNINKDKYKVYPIYLDKENNFYEFKDGIKEVYKLGEYPKKLKKIKNIVSYLKKLDKVMPLIHGTYGEDGSIQGFLELINVSYVGCKVLSSAICMDKFYTKYLLRNIGINVSKDLLIKLIDNEYYYLNQNYNIDKVNISDIDNLIKTKLKYPVFIKPCNSGSSVGVIKVKDVLGLETALKEAFAIDKKVLIEEFIKGKELECAILKGKAMNVGEVKANGAFYSYESKYEDAKSYTIIPAKTDDDIKNQIMRISEKAFDVINGACLARVDFFVEDTTNKIILNEINTMPGWTEISMYPKLVMSAGIGFEELIDILFDNRENG